MKIGIVGKGGAGKTTTSALLAEAFADEGRRVVAIDTDSNPNLGISLGYSLEETEAVPVLPRAMMVGAAGDVTADELIEEYGRTTPAGVTLLSAIRVTEAGGGCTCGGHATVRSLLGDALEGHADVTLIDMEAGLEHLSRAGGTLAHADVLLVLMEPTRKGVLTAARTVPLAAELGIPFTYGLGNKANLPADRAFFENLCDDQGVPLAGVIPFDEDLLACERAGLRLPPGKGLEVRKEIKQVIALLDNLVPATAS
ncbi:MAG: AAA family ATPase [Acidimicrobiia bacterium]|nr:AAA family ATPase [Acidimicrobiia bacterium]